MRHGVYEPPRYDQHGGKNNEQYSLQQFGKVSVQ
jgi:hypothetical protein